MENEANIPENETSIPAAAATAETKPAMNKHMKPCKTCGTPIAKNAKACPSCGAKNRKPIYKRVWFWLLCLIAVLALINVIGNLLTPPSYVTITDNNGTTVEMTVNDLEKIYKENQQAYSDRFGLADAVITDEVLRVGNTVYETVDNKRFSYVEIYLKGGWRLHLLKEPYTDLVTGLKTGDTLHIKSKITRLSGEYCFRDFLVNGNTITDRTIVTVDPS